MYSYWVLAGRSCGLLFTGSVLCDLLSVLSFEIYIYQLLYHICDLLYHRSDLHALLIYGLIIYLVTCFAYWFIYFAML